MSTVLDIVDPAELTSFVREIPRPANQILNRFLPDRTIGDFEATINQATRVNRAATFKTYDAETPIGKRDTLSTRKVTLPPIGQKTVVGEWERLKLEQIRSGGDTSAALVDAIYDDAEVNTRAVRIRMELARGDVLSHGQLTLEENGLVLEADWGVPADNFVAAAVPWSDSENATILADLRSWVQQYVQVNGERPRYLLTSEQVFSAMLLSEEMRQLAGSLLGTPSVISPQQLQATLEAHLLPTVVTYDSRYDVDGTPTRAIPDNLAILLPADASTLGYTAWGITPEALELAGGSNPALNYSNAPGLVGVVIKEGDPVRTWTKVVGVGMPILTDPNRLMVADVEPGS